MLVGINVLTWVDVMCVDEPQLTRRGVQLVSQEKKNPKNNNELNHQDLNSTFNQPGAMRCRHAAPFPPRSAFCRVLYVLGSQHCKISRCTWRCIFFPQSYQRSVVMEMQQCLHGVHYVYTVCVPPPRALWRLMGEKETECIVTPCSEPMGDGPSQNLGGLKGNYPHPQARGYSRLFRRT